jgi:hypothetical protein
MQGLLPTTTQPTAPAPYPMPFTLSFPLKVLPLTSSPFCLGGLYQALGQAKWKVFLLSVSNFLRFNVSVQFDI